MAAIVFIIVLLGGMILFRHSIASVAKMAASSASTQPDAAAAIGGGSTISALCDMRSAPARYRHVIWIWEENKDQDEVVGSAPYIDFLAAKCGRATDVLDSATDPALASEPAYAAATSGSNCNHGITSPSSDGSGCIRNDDDNQSLDTRSIFQLVKDTGGTWKSYQESMPRNCALHSAGAYAFKHNPATFYTQIRDDCHKWDIPIPTLDCNDSGCGTPSGALVDDVKNGTLPTFAFVTPNKNNDMHSGSVRRGDNWLKTYLPIIMAGPNYQAGDTAIFIMWDEASSGHGLLTIPDGIVARACHERWYAPLCNHGLQTIPAIIIAPSIPPGTRVSTATNNIGLLKTTQEMLGLAPLLGCASGTPPGGHGQCGKGSDVSIRSAMHL